MKTVGRVFAYLRRYPGLAAGTLACAILGTLMVIVFPGVTKWIIDDVVRANRPDKLLPLILLATLAFLIQHIFNSLRIILNNTFEQKVIFDLRSDLYSHIQLLPLRWFDNRATGDLMTRVIEDVNSVERVLIDGIEQGVVAVLQIIIVMAVMFYLNPTLALLALVPLPLLIAGALGYTLTAHRRYRLQRRAASNINALLHDNLAGVRQIKSFAREDEEHARFNRASDQLRHATLVVMRTWAIYSPSMSMFMNAGALPRPGIRCISPHNATTNSAPALGTIARTGRMKPVGRLRSKGSCESERCVFAMQTGACPRPSFSMRSRSLRA